MQGIIGKKLGMTRVFGEAGEQVPVTVIQAGPCPVLARRTAEADGYDALQLAFEPQKESRVTKARLGVFRKAGVEPHRIVQEVRVDGGNESQAGDVLNATAFNEVGYVDITATSKGRGFQGAIKRHGMAQGRMSHGGHSKRRTGSIGCSAYPGRVQKGKKMPGHMGSVTVTQQNLTVVGVREEDNVILVKGSVPGATGDLVVIRESFKKGAK